MQRRGEVLLRRGRLGRFAFSERARQIQATALHNMDQVYSMLLFDVIPYFTNYIAASCSILHHVT